MTVLFLAEIILYAAVVGLSLRPFLSHCLLSHVSSLDVIRNTGTNNDPLKGLQLIKIYNEGVIEDKVI